MGLIIPAPALGSVPSGDNVQFVFNSTDATGALTAVTGASFRARNLNTNATFITGVTDLTAISTGYHRVSVDTSDRSVWQKGTNYAVELSAGAVGAVDVAGTQVASLYVDGGSAGRLYDQAVKVHAGVVTAVDGTQSDRKFTGQFVGASQTQDQYKAQVISFQPKGDGTSSSNQGVGRSVLTCTGAGVDTVEFTCQDEFFSPIIVGDEFKILPEERELTVYTANITSEWGGLDITPTDQYSVWWSANGVVLANPGLVIQQMNLTVWRRVYPSPDFEIINENLTADPNSGVYKWNETSEFIAQNQGAFMQATALIDDIAVSFGRMLYNYV